MLDPNDGTESSVSRPIPEEEIAQAMDLWLRGRTAAELIDRCHTSSSRTVKAGDDATPLAFAGSRL